MNKNTTKKNTSNSKVKKDYCNTKRRFRVCTFTLNNFTIIEYKKIKSLNINLQKLIFQSEIGETGNPHLQGMAQDTTPRDLNSWKRLFGTNKIHIEQCRNIIGSIKYCKKKETWDSKIRYEWNNGELIADICDIAPAVIYPREIIDYRRQIIYMDNDENIDMKIAKKKFRDYINIKFEKFYFNCY